MKLIDNTKGVILLVFLVGILLIAGCSNSTQTGSTVVSKGGASKGAVTIFKSSGCGCCGIYSKYMEKQGFDVDVKDVTDMNSIKSKFNIPSKLQSCHTSQVGDYFVEGHVPVEAIEKLMAEQPDIAGLAMKGMPSGSPGMPGKKTGPFVIYSVGHDGSSSEFMRI